MRTPDPVFVAILTVLAALAAPAAAQYKWVDEKGTVTYSDLPPPPRVMATTMPPLAPSRGEDGALPAMLRATAAKHPVTLYTTSGCTPCQQARAHLSRRGIPFAERTVRTTADAGAFRKAGFAENAFPTVEVGRERGIGYEEGEWDRLLDTAGYPSSSLLPASYRQAPARGLAAADRPAATDAASADAGDTAEADAATDARAARRQASAARANATPPLPPPGTTTIRF